MRRVLLGLALLACLAAPAVGAPLFPDVPAERDFVATLAARGVLEGYPDGTFKGDRAASRWEVAVIVARLLHEDPFATREDLREVRRFAESLRPELEALGARLQERVDVLDGRVRELERITFYGTLESRGTFQSFHNTGAPDNNNGKGPVGLPGGLPYVNYNNAVGAGATSLYRPKLQAMMPVVDYVNGRALTNGTGFSTRADLGVKIRLAPDLTAAMEFAAYTTQGDQYVDGYWGVTAPYLMSAVTAEPSGGNATASVQPLNNTPYTRMVLNRAWVHHARSKTRVLLGEFDALKMDPMVYAGQPNLFAYGPRRFPGFGVHAQGEVPLSDGLAVQWEGFGSRSGDVNVYAGTNYQHIVMGADAALLMRRGAVRFNYARLRDEAPPGGMQLVGVITGINVPYGTSGGWNSTQWVNPPGWFAAQRPQFEQASTAAVGGAYVPNAVDTRPIPGWNGSADNTLGMTAGGGNFGPEGQDTYGLTARHEWDFEDFRLRAVGEYARSDYKSNRNSRYTSTGDAIRAEVGALLLDETLDLSAAWLSVDPNYNPAIFNGNMLGIRLVRTFYMSGRFHLHDFLAYPHNREGFRLKGRWSFDDKRGEVRLSGAFLHQTRTNLYDVRAVPGSAGVGAPNFPVLGMAPGFVDYLFYGFAHPYQYGANSASSFTEDLQPLENPRGQEQFLGLGARYSWDTVTLSGDYERQDWSRPTSLPAGLGGSQNHMDLATDFAHLGVDWKTAPAWTLHAGLDMVRAQGHWDPSGLYNAYAVRTGSTGFENIDSLQWVPSLGADWQIAQGMTAGLTLRYYSTTDLVPGDVSAGRALDTVGATAHPFSWEGLQVGTHFKMSF